MKLSRIFNLIVDILDLLLTLDPSSKRAKVFGSPGAGGGPMTKYSQLEAACAGRGERYSKIICLSAVTVPLYVLRLLVKRGARVVVNQNGVYYPLWNPNEYLERNYYLRELNSVATHTYFQSEFALESYRRWVGMPPTSWSILYNAVDRSVFTPDFSRTTDIAKPRVLLFLDIRESTRELWMHFAEIARTLSEVKWVLLGRNESSTLESEIRTAFPEGEFHLNPGAPSQIAAVIRASDVALQFVYNDVCPNKVLECLASGVYVLCTSAGGGKELVTRGGGEVLAVDEGFETRSYPSAAQVRKSLEFFLAKAEEKRREAHLASSSFDLKDWINVIAADDISRNSS